MSIQERIKRELEVPQNVNLFVGDNLLISFDCVPKLAEQKRAKITRFPVENGIDMSDHVMIEPITITLEAIQSDKEARFVTAIAAFGFGGISSTINGVAGAAAAFAAGIGANAIGGEYQSETDQRSKIAYDILDEAWKSSSLIKIQTEKREYKNFVISSLSIVDTAQTRYAFNPSITLQEVRIYESRIETIPLAVIKQSEKEKLGGKTSKVEEGMKDSSETQKDNTPLTSLFESLGVIETK